MPSRDQINWRPGRIQSLSSDQEVALKQTWAYLLKYWGYDLAIADEDIGYKESFIASSSTASSSNTNGLTTTVTSSSLNSAHTNKTSTSTLLSKKRRGLFGGSKKAPTSTSAAPPSYSKRMIQIQTQSSAESYSSVDQPSDRVFAAYSQHYQQTFQSSDDYNVSDEESEESDTDSMESFVTASTSLTEPDDNYPPPLPKGGSPYTKKGIVHPSEKSSFTSVSNGYSSSNGKLSRYNSVSRRTSVTQPTVPVPQPSRTASISRKPSTRSISYKPSTSIAIKPNPGILSLLAQYKPSDIHTMLFEVTRNEMLDNYILRFIRARKGNTHNALQMMTKSLNWRYNELPVLSWVNESDGLSYVKGINKGLIKNLTTEKSWVKGHDKKNNPLFFFQARKHFASDSPADEGQRFAVLSVEWCRLFMKDTHESIDESSVVFDLTGFSLKNADYESIKFLATIFEAHYPETLGAIFIYNAPWIFSTVWNLIKNWIDPLVASKIHFTKDFKDLSQYIDPEFLPTDFGGQDKVSNAYIAPTQEHLHPAKKKDETYTALRKQRDDLFMRFVETTLRWVESTNPSVSEQYLQDKIKLGSELSDNYVKLDPYVRCAGPFDRQGTLTVSN